MKFIISSITFILFFTIFQSDSFAAVENSGAAGVICDIITITTGRIGRSICIIVIIGTGFMAFNGSISWQKMTTIIVGMILFFAPANVALLILPSQVTNVSGVIGNKEFIPSEVYTPDEILDAACPNAY